MEEQEQPQELRVSLTERIGFQLRRAQDVSFNAFARRTDQSDLGSGQFAMLTIISENSGINQTALSQVTGRDKSSITPALKRLEKQGYIKRERSLTDRRAILLSLTESGQQTLEKLAVHAWAHDQELDRVVGEAHKPLLLYLLNRIVTEMGQADNIYPAENAMEKD
jgi:DNA-binding MarR family transcriptional regulator